MSYPTRIRGTSWHCQYRRRKQEIGADLVSAPGAAEKPAGLFGNGSCGEQRGFLERVKDELGPGSQACRDRFPFVFQGRLVVATGDDIDDAVTGKPGDSAVMFKLGNLPGPT